MPLAENQHVIQTVTPQRADQALNIEFCHGDPGKIGRSRMPIARTRLVKTNVAFSEPARFVARRAA
jgi:hypothetical protein